MSALITKRQQKLLDLSRLNIKNHYMPEFWRLVLNTKRYTNLNLVVTFTTVSAVNQVSSNSAMLANVFILISLTCQAPS